MRLVIQRVDQATIAIDSAEKREINRGLVVLIGIHPEDTTEDSNWIIRKLINMRIFPDDDGVMNLSIQDIHGEMLLVSQFTLYASTRKGNRPSYIRSAKPDIAIPLYNDFINSCKGLCDLRIVTGEFGADMSIELVNNGPVTIIIDSKIRE